ncbi:MAG: hypothetical protein HUU32_13440 [Calditrichaceae bacterium]|nr:hypothetical protein [Calditrichia bacterium]NUQ42390.1 hypothetical protein [Calditrichaceae bacterium]
MGKKNKKQSQKRRQAKSLKRRSEKKEWRKLRPKKAAPQLPGMPGMPGGLPGNLPPAMQGQMQKIFDFAQPLFLTGDFNDASQAERTAFVVQGFHKAFSEKDLQKRASMLLPVQEAYSQLARAEQDFEELAELLLKRHIQVFPNIHGPEERSRYTAEELAAAMDLETFLPEKELPREREIGAATAVPAPDPEAVRSLLSPEEQAGLAELQDYLKANYQQIDFIAPDNPVLPKALDFQNRVLDLFRRYLEYLQLPVEEIAAHRGNLQSFLDPFLKESHRATLLNCTADQVEEYLLDYYLRKVEHGPEGEAILPDSFAAFFRFAGKMGYLEAVEPILERIEECREEYAELTGEAGEEAEDEEEE